MSPLPFNPYPTRPGFGFRVANAARQLRRYGRGEIDSDLYSRGFDRCFEMDDGSAVVWALMNAAINGDTSLEQGIRRMGRYVWADWLKVYHDPSAELPEQFSLSIS